MNSASKHRDSAVALGIVAIGIGVLFGDFLFGFKALCGVDLINYFLPTAEFARPWLRQGILPLWNPTTFCGWPQVGDPQLRWFYPPNLLLTVLEPYYAFTVLYLAHLAFGALGMWLYLRRAAGVGPWAALCATLPVAMSGFMANHMMSGIVVFPATASWIPWVLLLGWQTGKGDAGGRRATALLGGAVGLQILAGSPQIVFYTWIALALQALVQIAVRVRSRKSAYQALVVFRCYVLAAFLGAALGASSLLPAGEFGALSFQRGEKPEWKAVTDCSIAPRYFWLFIAPKFFGDPRNEGAYWGGQEGFWDVSGYLGIGPLVGFLALLLAGFASMRRTDADSAQRDPETRPGLDGFFIFHLALACLALFLALGRYNPVYRLLYDWGVPGFDRFRVPGRWLVFWQFGLAVLWALVLERCLNETGGKPRLQRTAVGVAAALALLLIAGALRSPELMQATGIERVYPDFALALGGDPLALQLHSWTAGALWRAALFSAGWIVVFAAGRAINRQRRNGGWLLAALLVFADSIGYGKWVAVTQTAGQCRNDFFPRSPLIDFLAEGTAAGHRYLATDTVGDWQNDQNQPELWANRSTMHGLHDARGYYPLCLRWFGQFINAMQGRAIGFPMGGLLRIEENFHPTLLRMLNVRYVLSYASPRGGDLRPVRRMDFGLGIWEVADRLGPAWLAAPQFMTESNAQQMVGALLDPAFDPRRMAVIAAPERSWGDGRMPSAGSTITLHRPSPNRITLEVRLDVPAAAVVSEVYHPGWTARAGGKPVPVYRANHAWLGVLVPAGDHTIELHFQPESFRAGLYLSLVACAILAAIACLSRNRGKVSSGASKTAA
ncbi:MAG: YfhO family protein [Candidatus Sumerlaeia bacterium]|nr:YfhO family protein [Candidatus Sumerlaeia bacterium]